MSDEFDLYVVQQVDGSRKKLVEASLYTKAISDLKLAKSHACDLAKTNVELQDEVRRVKERIRSLENMTAHWQGVVATSEATAKQLEHELYAARHQIAALQSNAHTHSDEASAELELIGDLFGVQDGESVRDAVLRTLAAPVAQRLAQVALEAIALRQNPLWDAVKRQIEKEDK